MFWGLALEPGKRYAKVVDYTFHISAAVLDTSGDESEKGTVRVMVEVGDTEVLIANLSVKHGILQCPLDLSFEVGTHVSFYTVGGKLPVHLSGYAMVDDEDYELEDTYEDEDSESETPDLVDIPTKKRKLNMKSSPITSKKSKMSEYEQGKANKDMKQAEEQLRSKKTTEDESTDDDEEVDDSNEEDMDEEEPASEEEEEEDDTDDEDSEEDNEEVPVAIKATTSKLHTSPSGSSKFNKTNGAARTPVPEKMKTPQKTPKSEKKALARQSTPWEKTKQNTPKPEGKPVSQTPKTAEKVETTPGKNIQKMKNTPPTKQQATPAGQGKKTPKHEKAINGKMPQVDTPKKIADKSPQGTPQGKPTKIVKQGGVTCEDLVVGTGPDARRGKMVFVYYEGRLMNTHKMFDKCDSGRGFKFRLGQGEVISGWDVGVAGMKVGGKRRIICPPSMAYGKKGAPPAIPPQSTLSFVVELKSIS